MFNPIKAIFEGDSLSSLALTQLIIFKKVHLFKKPMRGCVTQSHFFFQNLNLLEILDYEEKGYVWKSILDAKEQIISSTAYCKHYLKYLCISRHPYKPTPDMD